MGVLIQMEKKFSRKIGILSISTVTGAASILSIVIPNLYQQYSNHSVAQVESLVTIPSLSALFMILLNNRICKVFGVRKTILTGLLLAALAGIIPFFISSFIGVLLSRILLGAGIGFFSPHALSLIPFFYEGEERATLLGFQMGVAALGNALLFFLGGAFTSIYWKNIFLVYLFLLLIYFLVFKTVPEPARIEEEKVQSKSGMINKQVFFLLSLCFFTFLIIWGVQLKIPTLFSERQFGGSGLASTLLAIMNIAGMLAGLSFGRLHQRLKFWILPLGFLGACVAVLLLTFTNQMQIAVFSAIVFNFIYSFTGPYIVLEINTISDSSTLTRVNSLITVAMISSSFIAPLFWNSFANLIGGDTTVNVLLLASGMLFIIGVGLICINLSRKVVNS